MQSFVENFVEKCYLYKNDTIGTEKINVIAPQCQKLKLHLEVFSGFGTICFYYSQTREKLVVIFIK